MEPLKYNRIIDRLICYALAMCGLGIAVRKLFFHSHESPLFSNDTYLEWAIRIVRDVGWSSAFVLAVAYGIFLLRVFGIKSALKYLSGGILGFMFSGLYAMFALSALQTQLDYLAVSPRFESIVQQAYNDTTLALDRRHRITEHYVRQRFISGELPPKYIDSDGQLKSYTPTPDEQDLHDKASYARKLTEWAIEAMHRSIWLTIGAFLFSCAVGLFVSVLYKRKLN